MKKLFLLSLLVCNPLPATNYNSYLPLKIGNRWIYDCFGADYTGFSHDRVTITITDTTNFGGKKYYSYSKIVVHIWGNQVFNPGMFLFGGYAPIRIDSVNGNISFLKPGSGCAYSINDVMTDSLNVNVADTVRIRCASNNYFYLCTSTSGQRYFNLDYFGQQRSRQYLDGVGLNYSLYLIHISTTPTYSQNLVGRIINGIAYGDTNTLVTVSPIGNSIPISYNLFQNYPNPFNPTTKIKFDIPSNSFVSISIYNILGQQVSTLLNQQLEPGTYETDFDASSYPSGTYFYKLQAGDFVETKKMVLMK